MSAFDVTLTTAPPSLAVPEGESILELQAPVIIAVPSSQGIAGLPIGTVRMPIERDHAIKLGKAMVEEAEKLPKPSKIDVASDLSSVAQAAEQMGQFTRRS